MAPTLDVPGLFKDHKDPQGQIFLISLLVVKVRGIIVQSKLSNQIW